MNDEGDVGLGAKGGDGGCFIGAGGGVEDGDAEGLVDAEDGGVDEAGVGLDVAGDHAVAVSDEIAVGDDGGDGAGDLLGRCGSGRGKEEGERDAELAQGVNRNTSESGAVANAERRCYVYRRRGAEGEFAWRVT